MLLEESQVEWAAETLTNWQVDGLIVAQDGT